MQNDLDDRITQKYLRRYPDSKRTRSWAGVMVHIETENGVWREGGSGYTYAHRPEAWVLPFEEAQRQVGHCGPEKRATFIRAKPRHLSATVPAGDGELVKRLEAQAVAIGEYRSSRTVTASLLLEAASRLSQGTGVTVKALEWKPALWNRSDPDYEHIVEIWEAFGAGNIQGWVEHQKDGKFYTEGEQFDTLDAAKAAVQAKYDRIIRSALSGDTV